MSWKDLIFEHEASQKESLLPDAHPIDVTKTSTPMSSVAPVSYVTTPAVSGDDKLYERLKQNTSLEAGAPNVLKVLALTKPLESVIPDPSIRLKAAMATAKSQGVAVGDIDHDLSNLGTMLAQEGEKFKTSIASRRGDIAAKEQQATDMEKKLHDLRVEISDSKTTVDRADTGFGSAYARRAAEIDALKNQFIGF